MPRSVSPKARSRQEQARAISPERAARAVARTNARPAVEQTDGGETDEEQTSQLLPPVPATEGPLVSATPVSESNQSGTANPTGLSVPAPTHRGGTQTPTITVIGREGVAFESSLAAALQAAGAQGTDRATSGTDGASTEPRSTAQTPTTLVQPGAVNASAEPRSAAQTASTPVLPSTPSEGQSSADTPAAASGESTGATGASTQPQPGSDHTGGTDADDEAMEQADEATDEAVADEYEDESHLEHKHSEEAWHGMEERFRTCNMMIVFSLTDATVAVAGKGHMGIQDMAGWIIKIMGARGVSFGCEGLQATYGHSPALQGRPVDNDRKLWIALRRGYVKVLGATVWMQPAYTGKRESNLSLVELEYANANFMSAKAIHDVIQIWGATEALVVSHGKGSVRQCKWPSIECVTNAVRNPNTDEWAYTFRLFFECEAAANRIYAASLRAERDDVAHVPHAASLRLKPVLNVEWDPSRGRMYRPTDATEREHVGRRVHVFGLSNELTTRQVEQRLEQLGFKGARLATQAGRRSGTVELQSPMDVERIMMAYGRDKYQRLYVGNVKLSFNTPAEDGSMRCFKCNKGGHYQRDCKQGAAAVPPAQQGGTTGRASAYWRARGAQQAGGNDAVAQGWIIPGGQQAVQPEPRAVSTQELMQQAEPMLRQLIASQVREQSHAALATIQKEMDRQLTAVSERIGTHEKAILDIQRHQAVDTAKTDRMEQMLLSLSQHLLPDFRRGEREGGAAPLQ